MSLRRGARRLQTTARPITARRNVPPCQRLLLASAVLVISVWAPAAVQASGGYFATATNFPTGDGPQSVAVGDFNGDSDPDLAVTNVYSDDVSILLGGAGGSFGAPTNLSTGSGENSVKVGDFNGDSDPDLAVTNGFSADVSILLGGAGGSFGAPTNFPAQSPVSVAIGDFNGDSDPDLAVANFSHGTVSILLGAAGGSFTGPTSFSVGDEFSFPDSVAIGDFDGDSDADLAVANSGSGFSEVSILLGDGSGGFSAPTQFPLLDFVGGARSIAAADFNGDSDPDLAVAADACCLSIMLGAAGGSFTALTNIPTGLAPGAVAVGAFNADSDPDLAVANGASNDVSILLGAAGGSFTEPINFASGGESPRAVAVGDFNGDSDPDLALANLDTDNVSILLGATPPPPEFRISIRARHDEGNAGTTTFTYTVSRSGYVDSTSTVNYAVVDGSATAADQDFVPSSGVLQFAPNETSKTIQVAVNGDTKVESDEVFTVKISAGSNATIVVDQGEGEIVNDDLSASQPCTQTGTKGNDSLFGGEGDDVLCGLGGNDRLFGNGGFDVLIGGNGRDLLEGNANPDLLLGGGGVDDLSGGTGNDNLQGGEGGDTLTGQAGSDALFGQTGLDTLSTQDGISGNDSGDGGVGSDNCFSDPGDFLTACP
jgi:Ca2+-binding RTX toxin-like protein